MHSVSVSRMCRLLNTFTDDVVRSSLLALSVTLGRATRENYLQPWFSARLCFFFLNISCGFKMAPCHRLSTLSSFARIAASNRPLSWPQQGKQFRMMSVTLSLLFSPLLSQFIPLSLSFCLCLSYLTLLSPPDLVASSSFKNHFTLGKTRHQPMHLSVC